MERKSESIKQIQAEHDERLFGSTGLASAEPSKATSFSRVAQVVLSCPVTSACSERQFSYTQSHMHKKERGILSNRLFSTLAFMLPANKQNPTKNTEMMLGSR